MLPQGEKIAHRNTAILDQVTSAGSVPTLFIASPWNRISAQTGLMMMNMCIRKDFTRPGTVAISYLSTI